MSTTDTTHPSGGSEPGLFRLELCDPAAPGPEDAAADAGGEWRPARETRLERLAIERGLPVGRWVSVELRCGRLLEGRLELGGGATPGGVRADALLDLRIGDTRFHAAEILTCIRLD